MKRQWQAILGMGSWLMATAAMAADLQVPPSIQQQAMEIQDRFFTVLEEECPTQLCYAVGCDVSRFVTLDQRQTSSLPGLDEQPSQTAQPQYKLASVVCEFTHEPNLAAEQLASLRQRLRQKVRQVGVAVQIRAKELDPKAEAPLMEETAAAAPPPANLQEAMMQTLLPFVPWIVVLLFGTFAVLALIWGIRVLGREKPAKELEAQEEQSKALARAAPTTRMLIDRIGQLKEDLAKDSDLVELTLRKHFEEENFAELCRFLRHFGPEFLSGFRSRAEYRDALAKLSKAYDQADGEDDTPAATWEFLDRLERSMTAAKVRIESQPIEDEFAFLAAVDVDEFLGILKEVSEAEALAAVAYAPQSLREKFFAQSNPSFTAKFVEHLARVEKMPDSLVRDAARKLREIYSTKGAGFRTAQVDRIPLLEQALNAMEPGERRQLVDGLGKDSPELVHNIAPAIFLDDSLELMPDQILTEAFLSVTPQEAGHYLSGFDWGQKLMLRLNPRVQASIRPYFGNHQPDQTMMASARRKLSAYVKDQDSRGAINLREINSQLIGR